MKKYAITIFPADNAPGPSRLIKILPSNTRLLCLKYYRAASDSWKDSANFDVCVVEFRLSLIPFSNCRQPENCSCNICVWQPPSLRVLFSVVVFRNVGCFELTVNTTFEQCEYAVKSGRMHYGKFFILNFQPSDTGFGMSPSTANSTVIVPGKGHGMPKFLAISRYLWMQFRH